MPIKTLFERSAREYLDEERDDGRSLWIFVHIPKTAGTSFRSELAATLRPDRNIFADAAGDQPHHVALTEATRDFLARMETRRYRFASGHLPHALLSLVTDAVPATRLIVMLRDPVARVTSSYHYQASPTHPPHLAFRARYPSLEDFVDDPISQNEMHRYLAATPSESVNALCERVCSTFSFVGLAERYDLSFRLLFALFGEQRGPSLHLNRGGESRQAPLPPAVAARIRERNDLDAELYEFFRRRYAAAAASAWEALTASVQAADPAPDGPSSQLAPRGA